jgi:hypothetical protein
VDGGRVERLIAAELIPGGAAEFDGGGDVGVLVGDERGAVDGEPGDRDDGEGDE